MSPTHYRHHRQIARWRTTFAHHRLRRERRLSRTCLAALFWARFVASCVDRRARNTTLSSISHWTFPKNTIKKSTRMARRNSRSATLLTVSRALFPSRSWLRRNYITVATARRNSDQQNAFGFGDSQTYCACTSNDSDGIVITGNFTSDILFYVAAIDWIFFLKD